MHERKQRALYEVVRMNRLKSNRLHTNTRINVNNIYILIFAVDSVDILLAVLLRGIMGLEALRS